MLTVSGGIEFKTGEYTNARRQTYNVIGVSTHVDTSERLVVYMPDHGPHEGQLLTKQLGGFIHDIRVHQFVHHTERPAENLRIAV